MFPKKLRILAPGLVAAALLLVGGVAVAQTVASGFGSMRLSGVAGGDVRAVRFGNTSDGFCTGWIGSSPSHVIRLEQAMPSLRMRVDAPSDTTLVVLGPNGTRCNDDANGDNPEISGGFSAGEYRVYVGSYDEGQTIRYTLTLSE